MFYGNAGGWLKCPKVRCFAFSEGFPKLGTSSNLLKKLHDRTAAALTTRLHIKWMLYSNLVRRDSCHENRAKSADHGSANGTCPPKTITRRENRAMSPDHL